MKLDCEPVYCHSPLVPHADNKCCECNENDVEREGPKAENEMMKEYKNGYTCELKSKNYEMDSDTVTSKMQNGVAVRNVAGIHGFTDMKDSISGRDNVVGDVVSPYNIPSSELEVSEKETNFYTDKNVMDCELPELIVCFKEGGYHIVKDICIDEGVPPVDMDSVENGDMDGNSDSTEESVDTASPISDEVKFLVEHNSNTDVVEQSDSENLLQENKEFFYARGKTVTEDSDKMTLPDDMHVVQESDMEKFEPEFSRFSEDEDKQQFSQNSSKEGILSNPTLSSMDEESKDRIHANVLHFSSKVESGSITFDFGSSSPETSGREEGPQNIDCQQPPENEHISGLEDETSDSLTASSRSFFIQYGYGESSFSAVGPLSGPIAYSGPIPYSGSTSLRSDSSTTSTRSFAFPILHSEWSSSPVKMAKADRRRLRKDRGWRLGLLCCRF